MNLPSSSLLPARSVANELQLRVIGCRAGSPDQYSPASGYIVGVPGMQVLVDCGPGVLSRMRTDGIEPVDLQAVVITHIHADHCLDLMALAYGLRFPNPAATKLPLYVPSSAVSMLDTLDDLYGIPTLEDLRRPIRQCFDIRPIDTDGFRAHIGPLQLRTRFVSHAVDTLGVRLSMDAQSVVLSSDTGWCDQLIELAKDADVFACEATYLDADPEVMKSHGHLTAVQTGEAAASAGVKHLVVTHTSQRSDELPALDAATSTAGAFVDTIDLAQPGKCFSTK
jgi:ribonuclease BN (tRNA processing enzyme)